jgi:hypothetical protein
MEMTEDRQELRRQRYHKVQGRTLRKMEIKSDQNEILSFTGKWMELENIILGKVNQAQKATNHVLPHTRIIDLKQMQ